MTLREILLLHNFRKIEGNIVGKMHENTRTVRVYTDFNDWFEFGIYDFGSEGQTEKNIDKIINKELLDSEVGSISVPDEFTMLEVYLEY